MFYFKTGLKYFLSMSIVCFFVELSKEHPFESIDTIKYSLVIILCVVIGTLYEKKKNKE